MQLRKPEPTIKAEELTKWRKQSHEDTVALDILSFIQNLDDIEEARTFTKLVIKATNNALDDIGESYSIDAENVRIRISAIDKRFKEGL